MILDPYQFASVVEWADRMALLLDRAGPFERLDDPDAWAAWAQRLQLLPAIADRNPPRPDGFADWRDWAARFLSSTEAILS